MQFASDNWAGASPKVIDALAEAARAGGPAYGGDAITKSVERRFSELFERDVAVFLVASGTFANALGISAYARPGGVVFCHREAHIQVDEAGATEFFGAGLKIITLDGAAGKLAPGAVRRRAGAAPRRVPASRPAGRGQHHADNRAWGSLPPGRSRRDRRSGEEPGLRASHGRRAVRQCRRGARRFAGRGDLACRRRRSLVWRHQERLPCGGGGGLLQPCARPRRRLRASAGGAGIFKELVHRCSARGLSRQRPLARSCAQRQCDGRSTCRASSTGRPMRVSHSSRTATRSSRY